MPLTWVPMNLKVSPATSRLRVSASFKVNIAGNQVCGHTAHHFSLYYRYGCRNPVLIPYRCFYRVNGVLQAPVFMNLISGTAAQGVWRGTIPAAPAPNIPIVFNITARDTAENYTELAQDSAYRDAYLVVDAGLPKTINENTSTRLIATKNYSGIVTWNPGGATGDTLITPVLTANTRFYASITDGICVAIDSVDITVVTTG